MSISAVNAGMTGLAAAQGVAAQAAAGVSAPASGSSDGQTAEAVQVAVLQKALEMERSLVNIFA